MNSIFSPYQGSKAFVFVSYARGDIQAMLNVITELREKNYRIWYDEGIPVGTDWPLYISKRVNASAAVLCFMSAKSLVSPNCMSEMASAAQSGKPIICVALDSSAQLLNKAITHNAGLSEDEQKTLELSLAPYAERRKSKGKIPRWSDWLPIMEKACFVAGDEDKAVSGILDTKLLTSRFVGSYKDSTTWNIRWQRPAAAFAVCIALLAVIGAGINRVRKMPEEAVIISTAEAETETRPMIDPDSIPDFLRKKVEFPDALQERAIRRETGITEGELEEEAFAAIKQLSFCGKTVIRADQSAVYDGGTWLVNGAPAAKGVIKDLSLMEKMYYLESLRLIDQEITSLERLKKLQVLQYLDVSGNPIKSLSLRDGFFNLTTLNISHTDIDSLAGISAPESLKIIYVSSDMLPMELDPNAAYQVQLVK